LKVLLVEDDPGIARFLQRGLAADGYQVEWVASGGEALTAVHNAPVMAILDLSLPDFDGLCVCRAWRRRYPDLPVLILSARDALDSKVAGLDAGADDYLTKPFAFEELLARLRALSRRHRRDDRVPEVLRVGPLTLTPATRQVTRDRQSVSLTEREFLLLEYLMRHAGRVVRRRHILELAWDARSDVGENTVDVYVGYLRRKLETGADRLIQTVRGVGFRLAITSRTDTRCTLP
jgi:DNA-binding response OmpR family regulator